MSGLPRARQVLSRWPGLVWALPIAALIIIGYLGLRFLADPGVSAVVVLKTAAGAAPGDTKVIYRGLQVGRVTGITLDKDGHSVDVRIRLDGRVKSALMDTTEFWLEGANFSLTDPASLRAAVSGVTMEMASGVGGRPTRRFVGLPDRPAVMPDPATGYENPRLFADRLLDGGIELAAQPRPGHGEQIERRDARRYAQIAVGRSQRKETLIAAVDEDGGRGVALQHQPAPEFGQRHLARWRAGRIRWLAGPDGIAAAHGKSYVARPATADMPVEPRLFGDDLEPSARVAHGFCAAQ